ncbi:MAG: NAD(P)H-dependent oxidoreductase [Pseudomonadota bacterium]
MELAQSRHPIRHVVILGHPTPKSFNHAIAARYCQTVRECGQEAVLRDLYELDFDPRLHADKRPGLPTNRLTGDIANELSLLRAAQAITFVYPLWFGMPPAIIKGYVDRVLGAATTPRQIKHDVPDSILHGKTFSTLSTSATTRAWLEEQGQWVSLHQAFDLYLTSIFGMIDGGHTHFGAIVEDLDPHYAQETLKNVEQQARRICSTIAAARHADDLEIGIPGNN